jgi:hypothetical protein
LRYHGRVPAKSKQAVKKERSVVPRWLGAYVAAVRDVPTAVLLTVPVLLLYEAGLIVFRARNQNAADAWVKQLLHGISPKAWLVVNALVLVGVLVCAFVVPKRTPKAPRFGLVLPLLVESSAWATLLLPIAAIASFGGLSMVVATPGGRLEGALLSLGAGFYEELVFRLGCFWGGTHFLKSVFRAEPVVAAGFAFVASSILFAGYHHVGPGGEPFESTVFVFRCIAGGLLAGLFAARGFAVAVWTHVIYDVICVFRGAGT